MANLRQLSTSEQVDREAESIKRFLESEKEPVIIAWGTKEGMESYQEARGHEKMWIALKHALVDMVHEFPDIPIYPVIILLMSALEWYQTKEEGKQ